MAKTTKKTVTKNVEKPNISSNVQQQITDNVSVMEELLLNATTTRRLALQQLLNPDLDIDYECHYPKDIKLVDYRKMFDREGVGTRVTSLLPDECWAMLPKIEENKDATETTFEKELKALEKEKHFFHYLQRADILSGIGHFGILLIGISDGKNLNEPVDCINEKTGERVGTKKYKLLYLKPLDESVVSIKKKEEDVTSPRFGLPTLYSVDFEDVSEQVQTTQKKDVHWTRVLHICDNRETSDLNGTPRMQPVWNRLLDVRKIAGGSGEMLWKGAYPGHALKLGEGVTLTPAQKTALRSEIKDYQDGLQRFLSLSGVEVQELKPQVCDPSPHLKIQLNLIALTLGVPLRVFMGSEAGHLASDQDQETWNKRIKKRQESYVTPWLIRLFIDRLIIYGVLPEVEEYFVEWPDLNAPGEKESAEISNIKTDALSKYVAGSVDELIPPKEFFTIFLGLTDEDAEAIIDAAMDYGEDLTEKNDEEADKEAAREAAAADDQTKRQIEIEKAKAKAKGQK